MYLLDIKCSYRVVVLEVTMNLSVNHAEILQVEN